MQAEDVKERIRERATLLGVEETREATFAPQLNPRSREVGVSVFDEGTSLHAHACVLQAMIFLLRH